jgi:hypothetical protein
MSLKLKKNSLPFWMGSYSEFTLFTKKKVTSKNNLLTMNLMESLILAQDERWRHA